MLKVTGYAASGSFMHGLKPMAFERTPPLSNEVQIDVQFCGVCHSDVHQVKNEWKNTVYPCVPGHEIVGVVVAVGSAIQRHKVGDVVGVGCMIDSCGSCEACERGEENYCGGPNSWLATYNGPLVPKQKAPTKENAYGRDNTFGGFSSTIVVSEKFVLAIPSGLAPAAAAPILCAGVTTYSPLKRHGIKSGDVVGIIGFGGLGHMATQIARAMGASVTVFTTTDDKSDAALALGASRVVNEENKDALERLKNSFDFILSTVPQKHDINPFIPLLKRDKEIVVCGALEPLEPIDNMQLAMQRKSVAGTLIGSLKETAEVLDFCAKHDIAPTIEIVPIQYINDAFKKIEDGDVRFRYVIDMASLRQDTPR